MILQLLLVVALIIISEPKSQRMDFQKKPKWDAWSIKRQTPMFLAESGKDGNPGCEGLLSKAQSPGGVSPDTQLQPDQNFKAKKEKKNQNLLTTFVIIC